jgi:hypothetical protein
MRNTILQFISGLDEGVRTRVSKVKGKGKTRSRTGHKGQRASKSRALLAYSMEQSPS